MPARVKPVMSEEDYAAKMEEKGLTADGSSLDAPDMGVPMAPPLGYIKQPSVTERIRDMVRSEHLRLAAEAAGQETFEEADDFEVGEDFDPHSPFEENFDQLINPPASSSTGVPSSPEGEEGKGLEGASKPAAPVPAAKEPPASPPLPEAPKPSNSAST